MITYKVCIRNPAPKLRQPDQWSAEFNDFVARCLVKDFEQRPFAHDLLTHPFITQVPRDTGQLQAQIASITSTMERKVSEPDITTKHGQLKSNRKSRRETPSTCENLALLEVLDEETIVNQLLNRYSQDEIYTYIGDILLAVNPFISLPIYSDEYVKMYMHAMKADNPPHIFAVADQSYQMMMHNKHSQCIVISGESGAGKTESANLLVQQLTQLGKAPNRTLEDRILQVNPLMEAFGNAKTVINDNSSRFGKYLEMFFTASSGTVVGAKITEYLLEKSRVIHQASGEQNFHIFYYLHDGLMASQREAEYHLKQHTVYKYITEYTERPSEISSISINRVKFRAIEHCFDIIGFKQEEVSSVYAILVAILHTGNIEFTAKDSGYGGEACVVSNTELISIVSELLGLDYTDLLECLTTSGMVAKGEVIIRDNSVQEAMDARDAMAKALYGRLFSWIVNRISTLLKPDHNDRNVDQFYTVGLLDIFGFENFKTNSFEQLCINIANEQIQYYFNQHIFAWELEEYKNEEIDATEVAYVDNRPILDMVLSKPVGLLALLDEESHFPKATDSTLVEKFHQNIKSSIYSRPKSNELSFGIDHYAGKVEYDAQGFLEKNRDRLPSEITNIMRMSENSVVKSLFQTPLTKTGNLQSGSSRNSSRGGSPMSTSPGVTIATYTSKGSSLGGSRIYSHLHAQGSASMTRIQQTVATYFRYSLMDLLNKMVSGTPHFVRCLKPNDTKEPGHFNSERITTQLRYTGVLETTRIRRQGYSHRIVFSEFLKRYHALGFRHDEAVSVNGASCSRLLDNLGMTNYAIGKSKVFLKYYHVEDLAQRYEDMCQKIVRVQSYIRMWLARTRFYQFRWRREKASIVIQKHMRGFVTRKKYTAIKNQRNEAATTIQKAMKGHVARKKYKPVIAKRREAAVVIQANVRGYLCRKKVQHMKVIKEEEEVQTRKEMEDEKAKKIQRYYRRHRVKKTTNARVEARKRKEKSAVKIQSFYRMWKARVAYSKLMKERSRQAAKLVLFGQQLEDQIEVPSTSPAEISQSSLNNSPSKKVWESLTTADVSESRLEQMKKMNDVKELMPQTEADYYDMVNEDELSLRVMSSLAPAVSVIVNSEDGSVEPDYDMDDEVMNFMHSHIHKQLLKFSGKGAWGAKQKPQQQGLMDQDTKAYFEEVIRGSALFGLMPSREDNDGFDDEEETFDYSSAMDNSPDYHSEPTHEETARTQLSRILLAKKVAEAFMSHKTDRSSADDDDDSYVNPTKPGPLTDSMASLTWDAPLRSAKENALAPDDYNENLSGRISRSSEFTIEADLQTERGDLLEEESAVEMAKRLENELAGSILALWQQRLTQSSSFDEDIEIEYASESERDSTDPPSPAGDDPSVVALSKQTSPSRSLVDRNGNRPSSASPIKLPISSGEAGTSPALEEIRSRLRKTQFDYTADTRVRICDATPQLDYRSVLKKKGNA
ncbi:myosin-IIIb-like [Physella acuta]|uniref:myosin-IIIb-like n=1 Tax=Physella acuta TaxID=109671 RepID=UPI0027DBBEA8|nr:myosin-IIIb-like [Physella acuta]